MLKKPLSNGTIVSSHYAEVIKMQISIESIRQRSNSIFKAAGLSESDAAIITEVLLETEMRGVFTHGFFRLERYIKCIRSGGIKTDGSYELIFDSPSWAQLDGKGNLGTVISYKAMSLAMEKAKATGIGVVNVKGSHHFGAAGYYTSMCANNGMAGISMSNGDRMIAATGSAAKVIGNNPFSYAFPAHKYGKVVYDIAMSHTSDIKVLQAEKEGKQIPAGWLVDKNGNPTTDPAEYLKGGILMPFGGYKGYGLSMMVELFGALLSGAAMTKDVHAWNAEPGQNGNVGHFFMALDISKLGDPMEYKLRTDALIDEIKSAKKAEGIDTIFYPGEIEQKKLEACLESGYVNIADDTMEAIARVESELGLS